MVPVQQELNGFLTAAYNYGDMVIVVVGKFDLGSDFAELEEIRSIQSSRSSTQDQDGFQSL